MTKSVTMICNKRSNEQYHDDPTSIVSIHPCQGILSPYEKRQVYFKFSPQFVKSKKGWKNEDKLPPRQDYAIFMRIQCVRDVVGDKGTV